MRKKYWIYILTNKSNTLYIGVTNDLMRRLWEHKNKLVKGFSSKYNLNRLIYFEEYKNAIEAIAREKKIKGWLRKKKIELIKTANPKFIDLSNKFSHELRTVILNGAKAK